jgi:hypothetical protein
MRPQVLLVALAVFAVLVALPVGKGETWTVDLLFNFSIARTT